MSYNREKFLLILLSSIFAFQASVFTYGVLICTRIQPKATVKEICPDLGDRYDQTFSVMIATVLALLGGGAAMNAAQGSKSSSRPPQTPDASGPKPRDPSKP